MRKYRVMTTASAGVAVLCGLGAVGTTAHASPSASPNDSARKVQTRIDVDGDRKRDVIRTQRLRHGNVRVIVRTSRGKHLSRTVHGVETSRAHWFGATRIDGVRGAELVASRGAIGDSAPFTVLTERHGRLVRLKAPRAASGWSIYTGPGFVNGYERSGHGRKATLTYNHLGDRGKKWTGRTRDYRWRRGHWVRVDTDRIRARTERSAWRRYGGWQMPRLPRI